ncbi:MAG: hypothetical protein IKM33_03045 [Clostridia bacterium]|nr:hypothetical protein [Clostridia bacterium]
MKKLFLIAFLLLALVITAVACGKNPAEEGTTSDTTAGAPETIVGSETTAGSETTGAGETTAADETTDAEETTEAEVSLINKSYEVFFVNGKNFFKATAKADTQLIEAGHTVVTAEGVPCESVALRGWIGFSQAVAKFGYAIDGGETVYADEFKATSEEALLQIGGQYTSRFVITVDTTDLEAGEHKVVFAALLEGGDEIAFYDELTLVITTPASAAE